MLKLFFQIVKECVVFAVYLQGFEIWKPHEQSQCVFLFDLVPFTVSIVNVCISVITTAWAETGNMRTRRPKPWEP